MITVNNGTASAQAIARGATSVGTGSAPRTMRASISSFRTIEPSSAASPAPIRAATSRPARIGPTSTRTATARKLGKADSAPCCDQQPVRLEPGHQPHAQAGPQDNRQAPHGHLLELRDHLARMPDHRGRDRADGPIANAPKPHQAPSHPPPSDHMVAPRSGSSLVWRKNSSSAPTEIIRGSVTRARSREDRTGHDGIKGVGLGGLLPGHEGQAAPVSFEDDPPRGGPERL